MNTIVVIVGLVAGTLTTSSFAPQVVKIYLKKKADEISATMFSVILMGMILWVLYGYMINSTPVIIANSISGVLCLTILILKFHYEKNI
ncbi:MAG: SemiSWEET transporter [Candidatus Micrarchaeaceae archaeon]